MNPLIKIEVETLNHSKLCHADLLFKCIILIPVTVQLLLPTSKTKDTLKIKVFVYKDKVYNLGAGFYFQQHVQVYWNVGSLHHETEPGTHPWTAGCYHILLGGLRQQLHPHLHIKDAD